jgi:predicted nucleotidyltransferase
MVLVVDRASFESGNARAPRSRCDRLSRPIDVTPLRLLLERIIQRWQPHQVWLFGSRARGDAQPSSDWDLLVVVPDTVADSEFDPLVGWRLQKDSGVRADVFPCRASDFSEDTQTPNTLAYDAAADGLLLYER